MAFTPPFCPHSGCQNHLRSNISTQNWFVRNGHSLNLRTGRYQRFRCRQCKQYFCENTFHLDFRSRYRLDYKRIFNSVNNGSGIRDIAREFKVSDKVVLNRLSRLARQAMATLAQIAMTHQITESIAVDGFESFVHSKYWPNNFTIAVGSKSQFVYACDYAQMRRKGRMTEKQREKRETLNQMYPIGDKQIRQSFLNVIDTILLRWQLHSRTNEQILDTDEHMEYLRGLETHQGWNQLCKSKLVSHRRTNSRMPRNQLNPLFPVNYFDREIRKDQACHVRKTVQWSKTVNNSMERMMIYLAYHNIFKPFRINERMKMSHAEMAGVDRNLIRSQKRFFFTRRSFIKHFALDVGQWKTWHRIWKTPVLDLKIENPDFAVV